MKRTALLLVIALLLACVSSCNGETLTGVKTMSVQVSSVSGDTATARVISCSEKDYPSSVTFTVPADTLLYVNDTLSLTYKGDNDEDRLDVQSLSVLSYGDVVSRYSVEDNDENREAGKAYTCVVVSVDEMYDSFFVGKNAEDDDGITYVIDCPDWGYYVAEEYTVDVTISGAIYDVSKKTVRAEAVYYTVVASGNNQYYNYPVVADKPVLYLYPETETEVSVKLSGPELTCTYPAYNEGWKVTAQPDGTLTDESGKIYSYLYWEGLTDAEWDFSSGFCIEGYKTAEFLEEALEKLGLTRREANEFIVYWLPLMQDNEYNVISFQTDVYTEAAKLEISPAPDTLIRVFMTWYASDTAVDITEQELTSPARDGFVAVEWGGSRIK